MSETSRQYWQRHVQAQRGSGLNIKAYARRESLSVHMLYRWRAQLGQTRRHASNQGLQMSRLGFAQAIAVGKPPSCESREAAERHHEASIALSPCRLILGPGMHLEMAALPSPQWLMALVNACQEAC